MIFSVLCKPGKYRENSVDFDVKYNKYVENVSDIFMKNVIIVEI